MGLFHDNKKPPTFTAGDFLKQINRIKKLFLYIGAKNRPQLNSGSTYLDFLAGSAFVVAFSSGLTASAFFSSVF